MSPQLARPNWEAYALARTAGRSQSEAYRRAYPRSANWKDDSRFRQAKRLEANPLIKARLAELRAEVAQRNHLEADELIQDLRRIKEAHVGDFIDWKDGVVTVKNSEKISTEKMSALESIVFGPNGEIRKIKMLNHIAAIKALAAHFLRPEDTEQIGTFVYNVIHQAAPVDHEPKKLLEAPQPVGRKPGAAPAK